MAIDVLKMREQRFNLVKKSRAILEKRDAEKRELTTEEEAEVKKIFDEVDALKAKIAQIEKQLAEEEEIKDPDEGEGAGEGEERGRRRTPPVKLGPDGLPLETRSRRESADTTTPEQRDRFHRFLGGGKAELSDKEFRMLNSESGAAGGYLLPYERYLEELIAAITVLAPIRSVATVLPADDAKSLGVPTLETPPSAPLWTPEVATGGLPTDSAMGFGKRNLTPHQLAKLIKVSEVLLRKASRAEGIVRGEIAKIFAATEEYAFMLGNGVGQPLGLFVASLLGISTARDYSTDNTQTAITGDALIGAKGMLKGPYQKSPTTRWIFHRDAVTRIRKLKGTDGQYLWQPGLQAGQPDMLINTPILDSEYAPNVFTAGKYVGLIGDLSYYWIADGLKILIKRLDELYAEEGLVGFIAKGELDAMPVLEEAFVRLQLAA